MKRGFKVHHIVEHLTLESKISLGIGAVFLICCWLSSYWLNEWTGNQGSFLMCQWTMPGKTKIISSEMLKENLQDEVGRLINPMQAIYNTLPYYKSKSIALGIYEEELAGYFGVPDENQMITLDEDNLYQPAFPTPQKQVVDIEKLSNTDYLKSKLFIGGDGKLTIDENLLSQWDFKELAQTPIRIDESKEGPKILIFHTHSKEKYAGENVRNDDDQGIVAVGKALETILEQKYGIETLHVTDSFYPGEDNYDTNGAYERMEPVITSILKNNPSIQMTIDLHRDGVRDKSVKLVGDYKGKPAAKFMFVNGMCQSTNSKGENIPMKTLQNPYLAENLALSVQAQLEAMKYYPDLTRKIYLKPYRYSLHMLPNSLLIEVGADTNTPEEAIRTAEPIADILAKVLQKD